MRVSQKKHGLLWVLIFYLTSGWSIGNNLYCKSKWIYRKAFYLHLASKLSPVVTYSFPGTLFPRRFSSFDLPVYIAIIIIIIVITATIISSVLGEQRLHFLFLFRNRNLYRNHRLHTLACLYLHRPIRSFNLTINNTLPNHNVPPLQSIKLQLWGIETRRSFYRILTLVIILCEILSPFVTFFLFVFLHEFLSNHLSSRDCDQSVISMSD